MMLLIAPVDTRIKQKSNKSGIQIEISKTNKLPVTKTAVITNSVPAAKTKLLIFFLINKETVAEKMPNTGKMIESKTETLSFK